MEDIIREMELNQLVGIDFCYNGNLGRLQDKTKANFEKADMLLSIGHIDKGTHTELKAEILAYFTKEIESVQKNPAYYLM